MKYRVGDAVKVMNEYDVLIENATIIQKRLFWYRVQWIAQWYYSNGNKSAPYARAKWVTKLGFIPIQELG